MDKELKYFYDSIREKSEINLNKVAEEICGKLSFKKVLKKINRTKNEKSTRDFNNLLLQELALRGYEFSNEEEKLFTNEIIKNEDYRWVGLSLNDYEKKLPLTIYKNGSKSFPMEFGLQSKKRDGFNQKDVEEIKILINENINLNNILKSIGPNTISHSLIGSYEDVSMSEQDLIIRIISKLNPNVENIAISKKEITVKELYRKLFNFSVFGGAYDFGHFGAKSRLISWKVISSLLQKEFLTLTKEELIQKANSYYWNEFTLDFEDEKETEDYWFINDWIDLGIIGLNKEEKKFCILANTDTD